MKKVFFLFALVAGLATAQLAQAQVNVNINIGSQPQWGPYGYNQARYYYLPEINVYYDIYNKTYVYQNRRSWVTTRTLPRQYRNVNLYNTYKVVLNSNTPWRNNSTHIRQYNRYGQDRTQVSIRDYAYRNNRRSEVTERRNDRSRDYANSRNNGRRR
ncbi:hypothetical protein [Niabella beijingensis]|uniref:hypothetical protein n=1 Tax=Niabella beijingensis TaxID=2872700 RepID=UPI001CBD7236|nr:hypothetical protein [Niabella beijingensis]MBZ4191770.1 hypothetical protein [Niabella beijingensis]